MKQMKKLALFSLALMAIAIMTGCADVTQVQDCIPTDEHTYGFWGGVWHGMIQPFSFIGSIIWDDVAVYAVNNNGSWYDFGFVGGFGVMVRLIAGLIKLIAATR